MAGVRHRRAPAARDLGGTTRARRAAALQHVRKYGDPVLRSRALEIDRFDPLTGWQFSRLVRLHAPGGSFAWTPPAAGRWRARARFLGTRNASGSRSRYARVLIATPLTE